MRNKRNDIRDANPQGRGMRPADLNLTDAKHTPIHDREDWIRDSDGTWICDWYMEDGYDVRCRD